MSSAGALGAVMRRWLDFVIFAGAGGDPQAVSTSDSAARSEMNLKGDFMGFSFEWNKDVLAAGFVSFDFTLLRSV
jgi:hypothetical protein